MSDLRDTPEYEFGRRCQEKVAEHFRCYGFRIMDVDDRIASQAPMYAGHGFNVIAPDLLAAEGFKVEVKGKSRSTWFRLGGYYEHGYPARQHRGYQESQRSDGQPVIMAIYENHEPTEGPEDIPGQWPMMLYQFLDKLGAPRVAEMDGEPHVYFPRSRFQDGDGFLQELVRRPPPTGPKTRRLL